MNRRLAIIFHRFGPYHWARLRVAAKCFDILALEEAAKTADYAWDAVGGEDGFQRVTLFATGENPETIHREMAFRMEAELDRFQPEAVAIPGWNDAGALAALSWALRRRVAVVVMSDSTARDHVRRPWKEWIKRRIVGRCQAALVAGVPHREYAVALGMDPARVHLGYDVVDNRYFQNAADAARDQSPELRWSLGLPDRYFLASNRFLEKKNLSALLEAYAAYRREVDIGGWSLVLLGDGPLRSALERRIKELGLDQAVQLPGFKQYAQLPNYYAFANGFVHASTTEQWGLVVNEAMACGLPVLVSDRCGCATDLVAEGQNGWTFDPYDVPAIVAVLKRLSNASEQARSAMGLASRERISAWSLETFVEGLKNAVEAALSAPAAEASTLDKMLLRVVAAYR